MKKLAIHSVPRSGSTWLGSIIDSHPGVLYKYQPLFSYVLKDFLNEESNKNDIELFFEKLRTTDDAFLDQFEAKIKGIVPKFSKSEPQLIAYKEVRYHNLLMPLMRNCENLKVIGLIRNPLSVINSWLKAPKEFRVDLGWKIKNEWEFAPSKNMNKPEEFYGYQKWKEVALMFEKLETIYPDRFYLVNYSKMLIDMKGFVHELFNFLDLDLNIQTLSYISNSNIQIGHASEYSVFNSRKMDMAWENELPDYIIGAINKDLQYSSLKKYLY